MIRISIAAFVTFAGFVSAADAQVMITQEFPLQSNRESFFEYTGMNWNLRGPNFVASFGQPLQGAPAFGNFNPNAGIQTGFAFGNRRFQGGFNFNFAQGVSRSSTSVTPVINSLNGYPASIQAGVYRPFVLGLQPVVAPGFGGVGGFGGFNIGGFGFNPYNGGLYNGGIYNGGFNNGGFYSVPQYGLPQTAGYRQVPYETPLTGVIRRLEERSGSLDRATVAKSATPKVDENRESVALRYFRTSGGTLPAAPVEQSAVNDAPVDDGQEVAQKLFQKGLTAEKSSKTGTARMYYRLASNKATGKLKRRIVLKLSQLR